MKSKGEGCWRIMWLCIVLEKTLSIYRVQKATQGVEQLLSFVVILMSESQSTTSALVMICTASCLSVNSC
jgi:hypothetical protein